MFDDRNVSEENKQALWEYYNTHLGKAFDLGYNSDSEFYDADLAQSLKNDIAKFSAFKETSFRAQLESALTEDGKVVSWSDFKKKATELNVEYNQRWLKTEYHHTVATANSVEQWKSFEADADLYPNLRYNAVNDARTREKHQALDGLILPINHVFWKTHNVPLDWGCRCKLEQTDEEPTKTVPDILVKGIFKNNAALSGKVFGEMPYASAMTNEQIKDSKTNATKFAYNKVLQKDRKEQFKTILETKKGIVREHLLIKKGNDYNDILTAAKEFAKKGKVAELMPEIYKDEKTIRNMIFPNLISKTSNPDLRVGNSYYDIKRPKAIKNILGNANGASKQGAIAVISDSQLNKPLTDVIMKNRAIHIFKDENYKFNEVVFLKAGKLIVFNRKGV
ncbi:phage minor head protein [Flavobacterium sp. XS2P24]|uniref:phage head morphogenesis protein n=1 Tax=Flavobacterium sp. XS2P24 TaxID=3041249 RepID=UPI0024A8D4CD|nr:phage minor head protein [Flavobacterium sp. XS2P24]MDI6049594.1 phage minor head protein [Flavobacterium sp. XS2P24]